ncbi:hypothetical protein GH741_01630 [Aquibacillus halophilus]|uniref:Uncharacterized protein n=1 Tax=Aquibacillus halophilus TaxID=930132 RepID=A0A6A8DC66_9BACI|nr:hypothetical protein [Aquibacillus halophilus]MRH41371.1 hypothetical protein [Aquibacillus halophilus]
MLNPEILIELQKYVEERLEIESFSLKLNESSFDLFQEVQHSEIDNFIKTKRKPTLNQVLFNFIDSTGVKDSIIYKRAGIDRRHFSKIRTNPNYQPRKNTTIALALALELTKEDTDELLGSAGYSLSDSDTNDLVIQYCLEKKIYDINLVNQALDHFDLDPLTGLH